MMLDYVKTNRTLQEQYKYQDIERVMWMGAENIQHLYKRWKVITIGMLIPLDQITLPRPFP